MKQTDSKHPHVRGWGCYLCPLAYMAGVRDIAVVDRLFPLLIKDGAIRDNDVPVEKGRDWWRCFVMRPEYVVEAFARELGRDVAARELSRHATNPEPSRVQPGMFVVKDTGKHFGLIWPEVYNPDPTIPLTGVGKSYRVWSVT